MAGLVRVVVGGRPVRPPAHLLAAAGAPVEVIEANATWGRQLRTAIASGIPAGPAGSHIVHTADAEVWHLVTSLVTMPPYRHVVQTEAFGGNPGTVVSSKYPGAPARHYPI